MRKGICIILVAVLVISIAPVVLAAGNAAMTGPGIIRAGDTLTVSFSAGGGIYGGSGCVSYDSNLLTLQGYTPVIGGSWAVEFNGNNFVFYDNSMASPISNAVIFTATFTVNASVTAGTVISVSADNVMVSDRTQDTYIGSTSYSVTVAPPLSGNCNLAAMTVNNAAITPTFSPDVLDYSASVPFEVASLDLAVAAEHPGAQVYVENTALAVAATTDVKVTVVAENGAARTYVIHVARAQDPNYVPSSNALLRELSVDGYALSPVFSADILHYYIWLPYEAGTVTVAAAAEDARASVAVGEIPELMPGKGTDIPVTVTAEDGTQLIYTVTAVRAPAYEDTDRFLNGEPEPEETQPATEPTTVPTTEPVTVPTAQPIELPQEEPAPETVLSWNLLIVACVVSAGIGASAVLLAKGKKRDKGSK